MSFNWKLELNQNVFQQSVKGLRIYSTSLITLSMFCFSPKVGRIHPTLFGESHFWELLWCISSPRCRLEVYNRFLQNCYRQANPRPHGIRCDGLSWRYLIVWENGCSSPVIFASPIDWIENEGLEQLNVKINLAVKLQGTCACWARREPELPQEPVSFAALEGFHHEDEKWPVITAQRLTIATSMDDLLSYNKNE